MAAALSAFGVGDVFWKIAGWGLSLNLRIAHFIAGLPGAGTQVAWTDTLPPLLMIFAVLWLTLWRSWLRFIGFTPFLLGVAMWIFSPKPVGWIGPEGKAVLSTPKSAQAQLCRTSGGRFDGSRLMDHAGLSDAQADYLMPPSELRLARGCFVGEGDWQARYVEVGRGRGILSLSLNGESHAFGRNDILDGALIMRDGWQVYLRDDVPRQGPWVRASGDPPDEDIDGGARLRLGQEQ